VSVSVKRETSGERKLKKKDGKEEKKKRESKGNGRENGPGFVGLSGGRLPN